MILGAQAVPSGGLAGWAVQIMESLGGPGAAIIVGLDNVFPPVPSELVLPLAGFTASQGTFTLFGALLWTTLGSVAGAVLVYYLGRLLGQDRTRAVLAKIPLVKPDDYDKAQRWFDRHGTKAVFFGRMIPVFRSMISLPAGIERMPVWKFVLLTTAGSAVWNTLLVGAGYLLGENWQVISDYADIFQYVVLGLMVVALVAFVVVRLRERKSSRTG
jgi:membrane protein DedA with SNARE-associated domain